MTALDRETKLLALSYAERLRDLDDGFVDREEAIRLLGIAALCQEHVLFIGPPGTAKTRLLERFCRTLETEPFTYLLTKFTEPSELFGPVDVKSFQEESRFYINTQGKLPRARFAFLDEIFQGSSAILNTLLTLINERTFDDGRDGGHETPLVSLVGSSNDLPTDPVLAAFSDRFLLRCRLDYVPADRVEDVLTQGWDDERKRIRAAGRRGTADLSRDEVPFPPDRLDRLQQCVADIDLAPVYDSYTRILRAIRAEGVVFSDRRAVKAQKVFAASALLAGRGAAEPSDLAWLTCLWTDPRDEKSLVRIVADHGVPVESSGERRRDLNDLLEVDLAELVVRHAQVTTEHELREIIRGLHRLASELFRDHPHEEAALAQVKAEQHTTIGIFRERFPWRGLD